MRVMVLAGLGLIAACSPAQQQGSAEAPANAVVADSVASSADVPDSAVNVATPAATPVAASTGPLSCAADIGQAAADRRAAVCRNVSPATHPPCNAVNSCAMIEDEIARSCALFDGKGTPMAGCGPDPKSGEAAAAVVKRYYSALNARDFDTAWAQWGENGPPNQTRARFEAGFAHTESTQVTIGALAPAEGAAGSIYQSVPVTIDATLDTGRHQRFRGSYTIRRVNGVDGATPAQLRWHIDGAKLTAG